MEDWRNWELDEIPKWSKGAQNVLLGLSLVLAVVLVCQVLFLPMVDEVKQARQQEQSLKNQFKAKLKQLAELTALQQQYQQVMADSYPYLPHRSSQTRQAELLKQISQLGIAHQLHFQRIDWQPVTQDDFFQQLPLKIELEGSYKQFGAFAAAIANLSPVLIFDELCIVQARTQPDSEQLHFSILAYAYHSLVGEER